MNDTRLMLMLKTTLTGLAGAGPPTDPNTSSDP